MLPQGPVWQILRQQALSIVPPGTRVTHANPQTLAGWLKAGTFTVDTATNKKFEIQALAEETGCALFSEAALHLDHAAEHSVTIRYQLSADDWYSSAWLCVTFYYWAYFLALSITRMLGKTAWFLGKKEAQDLHQLAAVQSGKPGAGAFSFDCQPAQSLPFCHVSVSKTAATRSHDLIWRLLLQELKGLSAYADPSANQDEARLFDTIAQSMKSLGESWPSDLRNSVNYRPGYGYGNVRHTNVIGGFKGVRVDPCAEFAVVLDQLELDVDSVSISKKASDPTVVTRILVNTTFALDAIATTLHADVVERRNLDSRWSNARRKFFREKFSQYGHAPWPAG